MLKFTLSVTTNISMLAQASWMLRWCIPFGHGKCLNLYCIVMAGYFTIFSHVVLVPHHIPDVPIFPPVNKISPDRAENPKKGPKIFTESDIKISGTQNIERPAEGARCIFMPNHSQVRRAARNDHAELCTLNPLASTKAAWQPPHNHPQEYQSELF